LARILRSESSLRLQQEAIGRELGRKKITRVLVWSLAIPLFAWGVAAAWQGSTLGIMGSLLVLVLAGGYEIHLREIVTESRNLEGGRRGEQKMAALLAEQLADDHVILNDLEFRIGHERCQIDHLVLAPSGIYILESKYWAGTLMGDVHDTQWTKRRPGGTRQSVKSPVLQCERQRRMFLTLFNTSCPDERVHALAVFTHPAVKLNITNGDGHVFRLREAIRFINDHCFDPPVLTEAQIMELAEKINHGQK